MPVQIRFYRLLVRAALIVVFAVGMSSLDAHGLNGQESGSEPKIEFQPPEFQPSEFQPSEFQPSWTVVADYLPLAGDAGPHPDFILPTIDGDEAIQLSRFRGKKVLLLHFASW